MRDTTDGATRNGAVCPFCGAGWSDAMLARYDAATDPSGCACCGSAGSIGHIHVDRPEQRAPTEDLCCDTCGRAIFLIPGNLRD